MKVITILIVGLILYFACFVSGSVQIVSATEYFDSYGKLPWAEEKLHLDNFAIHLKLYNRIGYVGFYAGKNDKATAIKKRVNNAKSYLAQRFGLKSNRIIVVKLGKDEKTRFILQPVDKGSSPPFP